MVAYFIAIVVADFVGLGISVTVFPPLLLKSGMAGLVTLGFLLGTYPLGQFFGAAVFGKLSDTYGRKPMMILTLIGNLLGFLIAGTAIVARNLEWLFVGRLVAGIFAGNVAIAQAGMVDISDEDSKSGNLALLNGALGMSWIIGPPLGGLLADSNLVSWFDYSTPFWFESVVFAIMLVVTVFCFRETLEEKKTAKLSIAEGLRQVRDGFTDPRMRAPFAIWAVFVAGWWLFESYLPTFLLQAFSFSPERIGTFLGFMGTTFTVTSLFVVKPLAKKMDPANMVRWFLGLSGIAVLGLALANESWQLYPCIFLFVSSMGFALPGLVTTISNYGDKARQGEVLGMVASIQAFMTVVVMMGGGSLFAIHHNLTVVGGALLLLTSWLMFGAYFRKPQIVAVKVA